MSEEENAAKNKLTLKIPSIKAESETQTIGQLVSRSPETPKDDMETDQKMSIRKRRNLSKNRGQAARQREKTPEPGRTMIPHEDTTTSDDEDVVPNRSSREIEADKTYEEMKRLVQEQANAKDPVYDLDPEEVLEARLEATARRRRSVSPFALPESEDSCKLERKGSFTDPTNKLLSACYFVSPKDEDTDRRNSLTIDTPKERKHSITPPPNASPTEYSGLPFPIPTTPKKLEEMVYPDEIEEKLVRTRSLKSPASTNEEEVFTFEEKELKHQTKPDAKPKPSPKPPESVGSGELVTKVIQIERTPSKKVSQESKPVIEVRERERIVRTPSRKLPAEIKPVLAKQPPKPAVRDESQPQAAKVPPVKPARSKSATRFGSKTSKSEMSEDQFNQLNLAAGSRRRVVPIPRRFQKNRSPRAHRSQSVARVEDLKVVDNTGLAVTKTTKDIIELMEKRARSLSISKDDPRILPEYKGRTLQTPNKTPVSRTSRGISCPKTIQIISGEEILTGIKTKRQVGPDPKKRTKRSRSYIDASQSEYTSSSCSSSPSENEYDFDLSERTAELARKLKKLSQEVEQRNEEYENCVPEITKQIIKNIEEPSSILRKRLNADKNGIKKDKQDSLETKKSEMNEREDKCNKPTKSRWKVIANWQQFKQEHKVQYDKIICLRNRCISDLLILIIMCGLGGMMFKFLEGSFENAYKCGTRGVKRDFIESLWRGSHYLREEDWKSMARKKLYEFENQLHAAHEAGVTSYSGQRSWNFMNSFVYCLTLMTTIGYGHIAPKTFYGRIATIAYAIVGIPLFLIVLADFGKLFTRVIKFFWAYIRRFYYTRSCRKVRRTVPMQEVMKGLNIVQEFVRRPSQIFTEEETGGADVLGPEAPPVVERKFSDVPPPLPPKPGQMKEIENETEPATPAPSAFEIDDEFNLPISLAIIILIIYIFVGAVGYTMHESWNFFESFYFVFISMSTIGLGDFVPDHPMVMMASILYLVFGLALTSMCINVVQVKLSDTFKQASAKLGATMGLKLAEEDGSLVPMTPEPIEIPAIHKPKVVKEESKAVKEESKAVDEETKSIENDEGDAKNR